MKINWKRVVAVVTTVVLTVSLVSITSSITEYKSSKIKNRTFFKEKDEFDVLFFGSSRMVDGVYPMVMWNEQGIASYNMGGNGNRIPTAYWVLRNSLDYANPDVVVIDCGMLSQNLKADTNFSFLHTAFDEFPLSVNKIKAAYDLIDDAEAERMLSEGILNTTGEDRDAFGLLWDYSVYHSRWNELSEDDFSISNNLEKGAESLINIAELDDYQAIDSALLVEESTVAIEYLIKIIEECKSRNIDVVLIYLPFLAGEDEQREAHTMETIAAEYDVGCINFLDMELVDYNTDCYNYDHLNPSGARKVSSYLAEYLRDNYNIADRRQDASFAHWNDDYNKYIDNVYYLTYSQKQLNNYLMLLSDIDHKTVLDVRNNKFWKDSAYYELLKNLDIDMSQLSDDTDFIVIDNSNAVILDKFNRNGLSKETKLGEITLVPYEAEPGDGYELCVNGEVWINGDYTNESLHIKSLLGNERSVDICFEGQVNENEGVFAVSEAEWWE